MPAVGLLHAEHGDDDRGEGEDGGNGRHRVAPAWRLSTKAAGRRLDGLLAYEQTLPGAVRAAGQVSSPGCYRRLREVSQCPLPFRS
jgi:hypothetical protein